MSDEEKTFSLEYVQELRREAASYRTRTKELEAQYGVMSELSNRGIKADPSWVRVKEGQTAKDAVDELVTQYPHLVVATQSAPAPVAPAAPVTQVHGGPTPKPAPPPVTPIGPQKDVSKLLKERNMEEIKKDPVARAALRDQYRAMLQSVSNQKDPTNY